MKIIITGSLGHISKPLVQELVQKGYAVTVVSSNPDKKTAIEALGATAAIGSVEDAEFLAITFTGADAVYTMVPPTSYFNPDLDLFAYCRSIGNSYAQAIQQSGVKRVIHLSSIGAHLEQGSGLILAHRAIEQIFDRLKDVTLTYMRPTSFFYNLYGFIQGIKYNGVIAANYGMEKVVWVSPLDIAAAVAEELEAPTGQKVRYVASEELTGNQVASILGAAIDMSDLKWLLTTDEEFQAQLLAIGMNPQIAAGLTEMQSAMDKGIFFADYYLNRPVELSKTKLTEFAKDFAVAFKQS